MKYTSFADGHYYFGSTLAVLVIVEEKGIHMTASITGGGIWIPVRTKFLPHDQEESVQEALEALAAEVYGVVATTYKGIFESQAIPNLEPIPDLGVAPTPLVPAGEAAVVAAPAPVPAWRMNGH